MIDELVKTVRLHLSERLTSPLMGAYIVSWCLWNYKTILVLLSAEPVLEKFRILQEVIYPDWQHIAGPGLLLPLVMCLVYIYLYPYPAKAVYVYTRQRQREILEARRKSEGETPLTLEDSRRIREQLAQAEIAHREEIDKKHAEIERLKVQITALQESLAPDPAEVTEAMAQRITPARRQGRKQEVAEEVLPALLLHVLELIGSVQGRVLTSAIATELPMLDHVELDYALGELQRLRLATHGMFNDGSTYYEITHGGRAKLLEARRRSSEKKTSETT